MYYILYGCVWKIFSSFIFCPHITKPRAFHIFFYLCYMDAFPSFSAAFFRSCLFSSFALTSFLHSSFPFHSFAYIRSATLIQHAACLLCYILFYFHNGSEACRHRRLLLLLLLILILAYYTVDVATSSFFRIIRIAAVYSLFYYIFWYYFHLVYYSLFLSPSYAYIYILRFDFHIFLWLYTRLSGSFKKKLFLLPSVFI